MIKQTTRLGLGIGIAALVVATAGGAYIGSNHLTARSEARALRVQVILDESADIDAIQGDQVGELKFAIGDSLRRHGVMLFPYIFLAKRSELLEAASED